MEPIEQMRADYWERREGDHLVSRLREFLPDLTLEMAENVAVVVFATCPHCWGADRGCQCWNDE